MISLRLGQDAEVIEWVRQRIPLMDQGGFGPAVGIGVVDETGRMLGGVVFHNWQPAYRNIEVSCASDTSRWLTKSAITGIFSYPFAQLGCQRVTAATPRSAHTARKFLEQFGFRPEGIVRQGFGTQDLFLFGLLASEWASHRYNLGRVVDEQEGRPHAADAA